MATVGGHKRIGLGEAVTAGRIFGQGGLVVLPCLKDRVQQFPRDLNAVEAGKERLVAHHAIEQQPLV